MKSIDEAIWSQNAHEVAEALASGWRLPLIQNGGHVGLDLSLPLRVVMRGWLEGWLLLRQAFPELAQDASLFSIAVRHGRHSIVADFLEHGMNPNAANDSEQTAVHHVMAELSNELGKPIDDDDFILTLRTLAAHGADMNRPYPGDFYERAPTLAGHTIWSLLVFRERLAIAETLMPPTPEVLWQHPRAMESLASMTASMVGRVNLQTPHLRQFWQLCCRMYGQAAWTQPEGLDFPYGAHVHFWQDSDWAGMDLGLRRALWQRWSQADDNGMTPLHEFLLHDEVERLRPVLRQIAQDQGQCMQAWGQADIDGVRPCDLWAILLREPRPDHPTPWPESSSEVISP